MYWYVSPVEAAILGLQYSQDLNNNWPLNLAHTPVVGTYVVEAGTPYKYTQMWVYSQDISPINKYALGWLD